MVRHRRILIARSYQKEFILLTQLGFQTKIPPILPVSFSHIKVSISKWCFCRSCNPDRPEVKKFISVKAYLEIPERPSQRLELWCIVSSLSDSFIPLHDSYTARSLVLFLTLVWSLPSRSPSTTFFPQKFVPFLKYFVVCSIYQSCAALTENIAYDCASWFLFSQKDFDKTGGWLFFFECPFVLSFFT